MRRLDNKSFFFTGTESSNWQYICINMSGDYAYSRNMQRIDTLERPRIFSKRNEFPLDSPDYTIVRRHKIMVYKYLLIRNI